jgi:hypothetical protein
MRKKHNYHDFNTLRDSVDQHQPWNYGAVNSGHPGRIGTRHEPRRVTKQFPTNNFIKTASLVAAGFLLVGSFLTTTLVLGADTPPQPKLSPVAVTVDFGKSLGAVKRGLFSINAPYLSPGEQGGAEGLKKQLDAMAELNPPMLRLWNRNHPPASNPKKVFNPATDAVIPHHGDMALLYTEYVKRVNAPLLFTIAQFPWQNGDPLNNPAVRAAWVKWYTDVVVWMRSLGVNFSYIALFNEDLYGRPHLADRMPYFRFYNDLADSLRAANPGVKIGGTSEAKLWPEGTEELYFPQFLQNCGTHSDFMSWNSYGSGRQPYEVNMKDADGCGPTVYWMRRWNDENLPGKRLDLVQTEYGINLACNEGPAVHRQRKGLGAVWAFLGWRGMMRSNSEESQDAAFLWHFDDSGCFGSWGLEHPPLGTLLQLMSARLRQANRFLDSSSDGTKVACLATATPNEYMIGLVNRTAVSQTVELKLLNCAPGATSEEWAVVAEDLKFPPPKQAGPVLLKQTVTLPPFSLRIVFAPR